MKGGDEKKRAINEVAFFKYYERRNEQKKIYIHKNTFNYAYCTMFC